MKVEGIYTALITPIRDGSVDKQAFGKLLDHVISGGVSGLVVLGGTGEYPALSMKQRTDAAEFCIQKANGKIPVVVGIVDPGLHDAIDMGIRAKNMGADAVMLVTPYYVVPDQDGLFSYHMKFIESVDLPLILYNIPQKTQVNMQPETVNKIVSEAKDKVIGIKECVTNLLQFSRLVSMVKSKITVIAGEDFLLHPEAIMGADAAILATSNIIPRFWSEMFNLIKDDKIKQATDMHLEIQNFLKAVFSETNPGPLKEALKFIDIDCGDALLPLHAPDSNVKEILKTELKSIDKWVK